MKKKYKARKGAKFNNKEAQVVGETIESLKDNSGYITSEGIISSARKKSSPIHDFFEWSNNKAAEEFRLQQARNLVNHIVEVVIVQGERVEQKSFFSVSVKNVGKVYVNLKEAVENKDYRRQLLSNAISILENLTVTMKMFREHDYSK